MEEQGYIEIKIKNKDNTITPLDIDINDVKEIISDVESFLYPTRKEKITRPEISYKVENGSIKHKFFLPISGVLLFQGLVREVKKRESLDFLDYKRATIIQKFQEKATNENLEFYFNDSLNTKAHLLINNETSFIITKPEFYETQLYLYGEIYDEGGKKPNINIATKEFGNLTVSATKEQLLAGEKRIYKQYGLKVSAKKSLSDGSLKDLKLINFISYKPSFNETLLDKIIAKTSKKWEEVKDVDSWLSEIRGTYE